MRSRLSKLNCEIIDIKVKESDVNFLKSWNQGNLRYPAYYRYLIPKYIKEDKVLYMDCDTIVTADLVRYLQLI